MKERLSPASGWMPYTYIADPAVPFTTKRQRVDAARRTVEAKRGDLRDGMEVRPGGVIRHVAPCVVICLRWVREVEAVAAALSRREVGRVRNEGRQRGQVRFGKLGLNGAFIK